MPRVRSCWYKVCKAGAVFSVTDGIIPREVSHSVLGDQMRVPNNLRFGMHRPAYNPHTLPLSKNRFRLASPDLPASHRDGESQMLPSVLQFDKNTSTVAPGCYPPCKIR